jgi:hypothetical protein
MQMKDAVARHSREKSKIVGHQVANHQKNSPKNPNMFEMQQDGTKPDVGANHKLLAQEIGQQESESLLKKTLFAPNHASV